MSALTLVPFLGHGAAEVTSIITTATRTAATVGTIGGEVFTAGAILWTLNTAGTAVEKTYNAGRATGAVYFNHIKPIVDLIDWKQVAIDLFQIALLVGTAAYMAGEFTAKAFQAWHTDWVGTIDWSIPAQPEFQPITCTFDGLTVAQLRKLARENGTKGAHKMRKVELLEILS